MISEKFLEQLKPKVVDSGRLKALELDADVFIKVEMESLQVLLGEDGVIHIVSSAGARTVVLRLTEKF